ncbi:hypothetical protein DC31_09775 [Microbacterium sp. CH12i]|uniref:ComF family protein n=1 Tax=Microbacterium sp. CH12i TaxID=1479651 RepID=UPI00046195FF|nr:phosphoribosyltransferase family protein [Microbacterium sp. CH12i]KDA06641.1 hypothetical protein DC31_09775 [Microbacterium sp. CH12i]
MWNGIRWAALGDELAAFLLSGCCAGCDLPGTLLCKRCGEALSAVPVRRETPSGMTVVAALTYEGVPARCIRRLKEEGETMLARPLGAALGTAIGDFWTGEKQPLVVPVPTSRAAFRRRGYRVPDLLIGRAAFPVCRVLTMARTTADQRGLDIADRKSNVSRSMRARHAREGCEAVLVDDVITTGVTLDEAARALNDVGIQVLGAVTLAATPRHRPFSVNAS